MRSNALGRFPENNQLLRIRVGQRTKQDSADNREDRSVGADAESESEYGDGGEAGIFSEHAGAVANVLKDGVEPSAGADFADVFLYLLDAA